MLPAQSWQQTFPDSLLQSYISEAFENNSDLRTAQLSLEQSKAMLKQARLELSACIFIGTIGYGRSSILP